MAANFLSEKEMLPYVVDGMAEALLLLDEDLCIQFMNRSAVELLDTYSTTDSPIGTYYYDFIGQSPDSDTHNGDFLREAINNRTTHRGLIHRFPNGKTLSVNVVPLGFEDNKRGVLLTGQDITSIVELETELDMAFGLTLPNSKVEYKLKQTPEFKDDYHPETKKITITGIIEDGGYRHVVNSLKIFALLKAQGVANVIGIDKDELVQAIIFHDLGKVQPNLKIGDVVDPLEAFENGKLHAFRGAEIAKHYYGQSDDVVEIIKYHHHGEPELPDSFPWRLLPMFRLFQLIDGLSAAVTRGGVAVDCSVKDCVVNVTEENRRPQYNGTWSMNLYTGTRLRLTDRHIK